MKIKNLRILAILLIAFSLLKIDYRFQEIPYGLEVDDAEYFYSAATIGIDFDLDFSNQMKGVENRYLNKEVKKIVPFHPIGTGILAAPFVTIGNFLEYFYEKKLIGFVYFMYSLAPVFYLFFSILLLQKSMKILKIEYSIYLLLLSIFGTGLSFYAFDRFSMSHIYEFFGTAFLIFITTKSINQNKTSTSQAIKFLIGLSMFILLSIRWTNYLVFFIPLVIYHISKIPIRNLYFNISFLIGFISGLIAFLIHTKYMYGIYTLNQTPIVLSVENSFSANFSRFFDINMAFENIIFVFEGLKVVIFSQEFGIFFFAPIIFLSFILVLFFIQKKNYSLAMLSILIYLVPFMSVIVVQNTAFSYGYRYLFVLIPINILLFFKYLNFYKIFKLYLFLFSILGFILYLFFETTQATSLSEGYVINSFGMNTRYANPEYLSNITDSVFDINAYMHIVFTSFLGILIIKIIKLFYEPLILIGNFTEITPEVEKLILDSVKFSWFKLLILYVFVSYLFYLILKKE